MTTTSRKNFSKTISKFNSNFPNSYEKRMRWKKLVQEIDSEVTPYSISCDPKENLKQKNNLIKNVSYSANKPNIRGISSPLQSEGSTEIFTTEYKRENKPTMKNKAYTYAREDDIGENGPHEYVGDYSERYNPQVQNNRQEKVSSTVKSIYLSKKPNIKHMKQEIIHEERDVQGRKELEEGKKPTKRECTKITPKNYKVESEEITDSDSETEDRISNDSPQNRTPYHPNRSCSFGRRTSLLQDLPMQGPGPQNYNISSQYTRFGKNKMPAFSLGGRRSSHNLSRASSVYSGSTRSQMQYSHRGYHPRHDLTPGPAEYSLPPTFGYSIPDKPASSAAVITGRPKTPGSMNNRSPGPAVYGVPKMNVYKKRIPTFSILGKSNSGLPANCSPGPNAYSPEKSTLWKSGAKISFGQRHSKKCATLMTEQDKN